MGIVIELAEVNIFIVVIMSSSLEGKVVAVVGAGLVGALEAIYLAKRGAEVHIYEYREDIRKMEHVPGRSINLAMSVRGLAALRKVGLDEHMKTEYGIPMNARMIHSPAGALNAIPYGKDGEAIYSVGRRYVNEILLDEGGKQDKISYHFSHKLIKAELDLPRLTFENRGEGVAEEDKVVVVTPDLVIGCDGAYSTIRKEMMKRPRFNYSQEYIPHAYMELCIPSIGGDFAMAPNYLHIWPRGTLMMIGLPNQDKTFTVTLFMPTDVFEGIKDRDTLLHFFNANFRDAIPLIGKEKLVTDFFANRHLPLVSVKCFPYHCLVMEDSIDKNPGNIGAALEHYSETRNPDAEAMCDLAMYNYIEMRDLVNKKSFLLRKKFDNLLHWLAPDWWVPLYTSVTFSRMRYHQCIKNRKWQDSALTWFSSAAGLASIASLWLISHYQPPTALASSVLASLPEQVTRLVKLS